MHPMNESGDTIQEYIDLWANASASDSQDSDDDDDMHSPMTGTWFLDGPGSIDNEDQSFGQRRESVDEVLGGKLRGIKDEFERVVVVEVALDGEENDARANNARRTPTPRQIKNNHRNLPPVSSNGFNDGPIEMNSSPGSPKSVTSYSSIARANPFDDAFALGSRKKRGGSISSRAPTPAISLAQPFTPEELWNFHKPSVSLGAGFSMNGPLTNGSSTSRENEPALEIPVDISSIDGTIPGKLDFSPAGTTKIAKTSQPPSRHSTVPLTHFSLHSPPQSPQSPQSQARRFSHESPLYVDEPSTEEPRKHRRQTTPSSITGADGKPVSLKAAKMLGLDRVNQPSTKRFTSQPLGIYIPDVPDQKARDGNRRQSFHSQRSTTGSAKPADSSSPPYDATLDAARVWTALKKPRKPDTDMLNEAMVSAAQDQYKMEHLKYKYRELYSDSIASDIRLVTSGHYSQLLTRLLAGSHKAEAESLHKNDTTRHMDDKLLAEAIFGKSTADLRLIEHYFLELHCIPLQTAIENLYLGSPGANTTTTADSSGPASSSAFGLACLCALRTEREEETAQTLASLEPDQVIARDYTLQLAVADLYRSDYRRGQHRYLNHALLLDLVITKSDVYLAELCHRFRECYKRELVDMVTAKERSSKTPGGPYYPPQLVSFLPSPFFFFFFFFFLFLSDINTRPTQSRTYSKARRAGPNATRSCWTTA
jgi:hypothetical protein